jgi:glycogen(starch) synthase
VRVLMLSWEYPPNVTGGLGTHVAELSAALARAGIEVHVITPQFSSLLPVQNGSPEADSSDREVTEEGVTVYRVPLVGANENIYDQARKTNQVMAAHGRDLLNNGQSFDLIHAHDWLVVSAAQTLKHEFHLPLIATIHATERGRARGGTLHTDLQRNIHGAEWWLVYEAWRVIACSYHMASEVEAFFHAPMEKIDVIPNGVNPYRNGQWVETDLEKCKAQFGASGRQVVFSVGRLVHEKGFHLLVEAVPRILSEFPNTQFVMAGRGPEAPYLAQRAKSLDVADHVSFPGFISDRERDCLYHVAACAVFPSLYEPFGIVALEAMSAGCPVVVTEIGGLGEVVRHGKTGVTIYPDDVQSVAWGVLHTLRNPALAAARAEAAQEVVHLDYNWDTIAAQTIAVYQRVVDERKLREW